MKHLILMGGFAVLAGCSTPNPNPQATSAAYERVECGMARDEVYTLLGPPRSFTPEGDVQHCQTATWGIPHDRHGRGHYTVGFSGDRVTSISAGNFFY